MLTFCLRGSPWADGSTLAGVLEEAQGIARLFPEDEDVAEFLTLLKRVVSIPPED